jgi:hypothetical protein
VAHLREPLDCAGRLDAGHEREATVPSRKVPGRLRRAGCPTMKDVWDASRAAWNDTVREGNWHLPQLVALALTG